MTAIDSETSPSLKEHPDIARVVFEAANDAIFVIDPERDRIVEANPRACRLLGYDRDALLSMPVSAIHPREMLALLYFARSVLDTGSGWTDRLSCTTRTGERLPAQFSASTVTIEGRTCLIMIVRPVRQETHELLEELLGETAALTGEAFFRSLVEHLASALNVRHALIATVPRPDVPAEPLGLWWNGSRVEPFAPIFPGTPSERVVAGEVVHHPDDLPRLYPQLERRAPGVVSYLGFPLRAVSGEILGLIAVFDDKPMPAIPLELSLFRLFAERARAELERDRIERALLVEKRAAEAANRAKTDFLANLSHELRTPLNGVLGYAQILHKAPDLGSEQRDAVAIIRRSGEHLLNLIDDLLDLSRIESVHLDTRQDAFHFEAFLQLIVEMIRVRAHGKGLNMIFEPAATLPVAVLGDEKRLRQILINLLGNAVKFTDRGTVWFQVDHRAGEARFEIADTGIGIPEDQLDAIFQPFRRLTESTEVREGSGLGLAICRRLIDALGGRLRVRSRVGSGSIFELTLPLPVADDPVAEANERGSLSAGCDGFLAKPVRVTELLHCLQTHLRLAWEYRTVPNPGIEPLPAAQALPDPGNVPSRAELEGLQELAVLGDIKTLIEAADRIETGEPCHAAFARKLRESARGFRINELRDFLNTLIKR